MHFQRLLKSFTSLRLIAAVIVSGVLFDLGLGSTASALQSSFQDKFAHPGELVSLSCKATGRPLPKISWSADGQPVIPGSFLSSNNRIEIQDYVEESLSEITSYLNISSARVEDSGLYTCSVNNGAVRYSARVNVFGQPFVKPFRNITAILDEDVSLECPFGGYPIESLSWERNGVSLPLNSRQLVDNKSGKLTIKRVQKEDSGSLKCVARNGKNDSAAGITFIRVVAPPVIDAHFFPESIVAEEGTRARLICSINKGDSPILITWFKDGKPLAAPLSSAPGLLAAAPSFFHSLSSKQRQAPSPATPLQHFLIQTQEDFSSTVIFRSVQLADRGQYECLASNSAGTTNRTTEFVVHSAPKWILEPPKNASGILDKETLIDCTADGYPAPSVTWKAGRGRGGRRNEFRPINSNDVHIMRNGSLHFPRLKEEDETFYLCSASNGIGAGISKAIFLKVHKPPQLETKYTTVGVVRDKNGSLECRARGDLPIRFVWLKDGHQLGASAGRRIALTEEREDEPSALISLLSLTSAQRDDQAIYSCLATNEYGKSVHHIHLTVWEPPSAPSNITILNITSRTVTLRWSRGFNGNSPIKWYRLVYRTETGSIGVRGETKEEIVEGDNNSTHLQNLQPLTSYRLTIAAQNEIGSSVESEPISLTTLEEAPEGPPVDVKAQSTGSQSLKVSWLAPRIDLQHGQLIGYYIGYKVVGSEEQFQYKHFIPEPEDLKQPVFTTYLTNLKRLTRYRVAVQAYNKAGVGPLSDAVEATTLETSPPISPSVRVLSSSNSSIRVMWEKDEKDKSITTEYTLYYKEDNKKEWKEIKVAPNLHEYNLQHLLCGTRYMLYMTATNSLGTGEPGQTVSTRTKGAAPVSPSLASAFIRINVSEVTLNLAAWSDGGCAIHHFNIHRKQKLSKQWSLLYEKLLARGSNRHLALKNFQPGKEYVVQITARNDAGVTQAEYDVDIPSMSYSQLTTRIPSVSLNKNDYMVFDKPLYKNFALVLPIVISFAVILFLLLAVFWCLKKNPVEPHYNFPDQGKPTNSVSLSELSSQKSASRLNVSGKGSGAACESIPAHMRSDSVHSQLSNFGGAQVGQTLSPQKAMHFGIHPHEYAEPYSMSDPRAVCQMTKEQFATIKRANPRTRSSIYGPAHQQPGQVAQAEQHFVCQMP